MINKFIANNRIQPFLSNKIIQKPSTITSHRLIHYIHSNSQPPQKAYHKFFQFTIDHDIRFLTANMIKFTKARRITKIMISNHKINSGLVIESHVQNLYELINRMEPSIQAISMFVESVFNELNSLRDQNIQSQSYLNLLKPNVLSKMIKINQNIQNYYNQYFRSMMACLIVQLMRQSKSNLIRYTDQIQKLNKELQVARHNNIKLYDENNNQINIVRQQIKRKTQLKQKFKVLSEVDYWNGFQQVISMGYYQDKFLQENIKLLQEKTQNIEEHSFILILLKIKSIVHLSDLKYAKGLQKQTKTLIGLYNKLLDRYFAFLSDQHFLLEQIYLQRNHVQTQLITRFLQQENYILAKQNYFNMLKKFFSRLENGLLFLDIKMLKGYFQLMLIIFTHEDSAKVHEILRYFQKILIVHPMDKFQKLSIHYSLAEKYGFKSDIFAQRLHKYLLAAKQKVEKAKGHVLQVQQAYRQIQLARKALIYSKIVSKSLKETVEEINDMIRQLFTPNIFYLLSESDQARLNQFITGQSINSSSIFYKTDLINLTSLPQARKRIELIQQKINLKNNNKSFHIFMENLMSSTLKDNFTLKLQHASNWKNNSHARILSILMLANHNYDYVASNSQQEANLFLQQFLSKLLVTPIYNALKQKFAYPELLYNFVSLIDKMDFSKNYPTQARQIQNLKKMYNIQIQNQLKIAKNRFKIQYQSHMDFIQFNRVTLPYAEDIYSMSKMGNSARQSLIFKLMKKFNQQKQYIKMQIETFYKFNMEGEISVTVNYFEFPHLADIKVVKNGIETVIMLKSKEGDEGGTLNVRQTEMVKSAQIYWQKKGWKMITLCSEQQIEPFIEIKVKKHNIFGRK